MLIEFFLLKMHHYYYYNKDNHNQIYYYQNLLLYNLNFHLHLQNDIFQDFLLAVWGKFFIFAAENRMKGLGYGNAFYNTGYRLRLSPFQKDRA